MQNGTYRVKHKMLNTEYKLIAYSGTLKLYALKTGQFIKSYQNDKVLMEHCDIIEMLPGEQNHYDLVYIVNGKVKETIRMGVSYAIAANKRNELRRTTHKNGLLVVVRQDKLKKL